jgi:hypothetical protein
MIPGSGEGAAGADEAEQPVTRKLNAMTTAVAILIECLLFIEFLSQLPG